MATTLIVGHDVHGVDILGHWSQHALLSSVRIVGKGDEPARRPKGFSSLLEQEPEAAIVAGYYVVILIPMAKTIAGILPIDVNAVQAGCLAQAQKGIDEGAPPIARAHRSGEAGGPAITAHADEHLLAVCPRLLTQRPARYPLHCTEEAIVLHLKREEDEVRDHTADALEVGGVVPPLREVGGHCEVGRARCPCTTRRPCTICRPRPLRRRRRRRGRPEQEHGDLGRPHRVSRPRHSAHTYILRILFLFF
eukprot:scaffold298885_cov27-Tisochrysis_lutea.AAC.1